MYARHAERCGCDCIVVCVPYYITLPQLEVEEFFVRLSKRIPDINIMLYNIPMFTGEISIPTYESLLQCENIIGIKEASGNITQMDDIIKNKPSRFDVISGDDGVTFPLLTLGAVGVISVIGNAFPREFSKMVRLGLKGEYEKARAIHHKFTELFSLLFVDGNPAGVKCALHHMGFIENELRLPLVPTRIATNEKIHSVLKSLRG